MRFRWGLVVLSAAVAACGGSGGDDPLSAAAQSASVSAVPASTGPGLRRRALALAPSDPVDVTAAFDWAEWKFPDLFPGGSADRQVVHDGVAYTARTYANGNALGATTAGALYGLGPFTGNVLTSLGRLADFAHLVRADRCLVHPSDCSPAQGTAANECRPLAWARQQPGTHLHLEYRTTGQAEETTVIDTVSEGPATFDGQAVVQLRVTRTHTLSFRGLFETTATEDRVFIQDAGGGLTLTLGSVSVDLIQEFRPSTTTRYVPAWFDAQFALPPGGTTSQTIEWEASTESGGSLASSETRHYEFDGRELLSVAGRSYDTCRYAERQGGNPQVQRVWYHVGTGVPVRTELGAGAAVTELVQGTLDGQVLQ